MLPSPNPFGAVNKCIFSEVLPYFDMANMLVIPASHGFLRGIAFDLWLYLFNPTSYKPSPPAATFQKHHWPTASSTCCAVRQARQRAARTSWHATRQDVPQDEATFTEGYRRRLAAWESMKPLDLDSRMWYNGPLITNSEKDLIKRRGA